MRRRGWRRPSSRDGSRLDIAVEARLFGRVTLLTIDATVDIVDAPNEARGVDRPGPSASQAGVGDARAELRRSTVETLLRDASQTLDSSRH